FPEGGLDAWLVVLGSYANAFGNTNSEHADYYTREYMTNYSTSEIGWIGGIQFCLIFSSAIVTGRLFDRGYLCIVASRDTSHVLTMFFWPVFMLSLTQKNQYYQVFLSQGVGVGLSCGLTYVPTLSVVSHYFQRRRALAMGCVSAGSALGAVLHPIILNKLFNNPSIGFHNGVRIDGGINTFLFLISVCLTKTRLPPKKNLKPIPFVRFLKEPAYALVCLGTALCFFGLFYPIFYLQLNAVSHGVDESLAFYALSVLNAASLFGRVTPMFYTHRLGVFNLLAFFNIALGVVACTMSVVHNLAGTMIFAVFYGFTNGGVIITFLPALLAHDQSEIGVRMGICFFFSG
ncbi:MFS general substrate transporter, partial [Fistulina hepatica ATCC 64428]